MYIIYEQHGSDIDINILENRVGIISVGHGQWIFKQSQQRGRLNVNSTPIVQIGRAFTNRLPPSENATSNMYTIDKLKSFFLTSILPLVISLLKHTAVCLTLSKILLNEKGNSREIPPRKISSTSVMLKNENLLFSIEWTSSWIKFGTQIRDLQFFYLNSFPSNSNFLFSTISFDDQCFLKTLEIVGHCIVFDISHTEIILIVMPINFPEPRASKWKFTKVHLHIFFRL